MATSSSKSSHKSSHKKFSSSDEESPERKKPSRDKSDNREASSSKKSKSRDDSEHRRDERRRERDRESREHRSGDRGGGEKSRRDRDDRRGGSDKRDERKDDGGRDRSSFNDEKPRRRERDIEPEPSRPAWDTRKVREHADQIQKRKQLWKAADEQQSESPGKSAEATESAWSSAIAATAGDTVQAEKFARLMGLKKGAAAVIQNADTDKVEEEKKKQEQLLQNLDKQYALARSATHFGKGQGLGFHH